MRSRKNFFMVMLILLSLVVNCVFAAVPSIQSAELNGQLKFALNGKGVFPSGNDGAPVFPITVDGVTYLPLRGVGNLLAYNIDFNAQTKSIVLSSSNGTTKSAATLPSTFASQRISGVQYVSNLNFKLAGKDVLLTDAQGNIVNPVSYKGTTYLPLRALAKLMALDIAYDAKTKTIGITSSPVTSGDTNTGVVTPTLSKVWQLQKVEFVDGTLTKPTRLMGTTATMTDNISYQGSHEGAEPSVTITSIRTDDATGKLLAGVSYQIGWTTPPEVIKVGEKPSLRFIAKTLSSTTWTMNQVSMYFDQGMGVNFANDKGEKYLKGDFDHLMTLQKEVAAGPSNNLRKLQVELGAGFRVIYHYKWIP